MKHEIRFYLFKDISKPKVVTYVATVVILII